MKKSFVAMGMAIITAAMLSGCSALGSAPTVASSEGMETSAESTAEQTSEAVVGSRLDEILERGYIEVATEPYFAPNEFIDPSKQGEEQYVGADIEMAKYIADELGVECRIVPLEFDAVLSGISSGKYDLAISALAYTPARAEAMELSKSYRDEEDKNLYGLLVRVDDLEKIRSADDLGESVVICQSGSLQETFAKDQIPAMKELKRVSSTNDAILSVQENKADAAVVATTMAQLYIDANEGCNLAIVPDFAFEADPNTSGTRIGMPKGETALCEKINEIIDKLNESGQYNTWYDEYSEYAKSLGIE